MTATLKKIYQSVVTHKLYTKKKHTYFCILIKELDS